MARGSTEQSASILYGHTGPRGQGPTAQAKDIYQRLDSEQKVVLQVLHRVMQNSIKKGDSAWRLEDVYSQTRKYNDIDHRNVFGNLAVLKQHGLIAADNNYNLKQGVSPWRLTELGQAVVDLNEQNHQQ